MHIRNLPILLCLALGLNGGVAIGQTRTGDLPSIYRAEIGVREATGHNDGSRIQEYLAASGVSIRAPWCAAFVAWCHKQAGIPATRSAWSPSWFPTDHTIYTRGEQGSTPYTPRQGDVFGIYYPHLRRIAHVGFIDGVEGNFYITVEGNTNEAGSRNGDGVYRKRRPARTIYKVSRWIP